MNIPHRGPFQFDAPYNTLGIRVTNEEDGAILPRTYPYWPNINAHLGRDTMRVFLGTDSGPRWWEIDKCAYTVTPKGAIFAPENPLSWSTAEGWYWDFRNPDILYCSDDKHLYRYDFEEQELETVVDITPLSWIGDFALRQWHTSREGSHSATVKRIVDDGAWPNIGTIVYSEFACQPWKWFPATGVLDESHIDRAGQWLLIKENIDEKQDEDSRIIRLANNQERVILDQDGAAGHSDNGFGYMVSADNWQSEATWRVWMFDSTQEPQGQVVLTTSWEEQVIHVSHCNAVPGHYAGQWVLGSGTLRDLITFPLDGSMARVAVAPSMSAGGDYDNLPKANLDPHGKMALWTCQRDGRFDAFIVRL